VLGRNANSSSSTSLRPDDFSLHFSSKVEEIRSATQHEPQPIIHDAADCLVNMSLLQCVSEDDVPKLIRDRPNKQSWLDPIPTWLLKECRSSLSLFITALFNASLSSGTFPSCFKVAVVTQLLKKPDLVCNVPHSYRPISNVSALSKLLERIVGRQLQAFIDEHSLLPSNQSAYRRCHSTETPLAKVYSDLVQAMDAGNQAVLALLITRHKMQKHSLSHQLTAQLRIENSKNKKMVITL